MLLEEAKKLLADNYIPFEIREYKNEKEYWAQTTLFPYKAIGKDCNVIVIVIKSNNGNKHIELQFNAEEDDFRFVELYFGGFGYELFDVLEEHLKEEMMDIITEIIKGNIAIIEANDLKEKKWLGYGSFILNGEDEDNEEFEKALERIKKPKVFLDRILKSEIQYEIYDWNTYQRIVNN